MDDARLTVSPEADADLTQIGTYISEHDGAARANAAIERIQRTMRNLASMPGMGGRRSYLKPGQRAFPVPPWIVYYEALPEEDGIRIVRIIDGRRDLPAIFRKAKRKTPDTK